MRHCWNQGRKIGKCTTLINELRLQGALPHRHMNWETVFEPKSSNNFTTQAGRLRVFLLAVAQGADPVLPEDKQSAYGRQNCSVRRLSFSKQTCGNTFWRLWGVQDMPDIDHFLRKPTWNESNAPPLHKWLCEQKGDAHKARMDTLGNMVVPQQAFLAMSVLGRMVRGKYF